MDFVFAACLAGACCIIVLFVFACYLRRPAPVVHAEQILAIGHKFVTSPDGRKIEYSVSGDLDGVPVYYQHAYLNGCLLMRSWHSVAQECGVKLIAASLPGFGLSDSYPLGVQRSLVNWPNDVLSILRQEGIPKIHLCGASAGCVYTAALARGLPIDMVGNVCFICPTCPPSVAGSTDQMDMATRIIKYLMGKPYFGDFIAFAMTRLMSPRELSNKLPDAKAFLARLDREMPDVAQHYMESCEHGVSFTYRGVVDNAFSMEQDLPFDLGNLQQLVKAGRAVGITSAEDDGTNPPMMQQWFQSQILGSKILAISPGWGHLHFCVPAVFKRILTFLLNGVDVVDKAPMNNCTLLTCKRQETAETIDRRKVARTMQGQSKITAA